MATCYLRISPAELTWTRTHWRGKTTLPANEIEELYVAGKGTLVALSDCEQLMMEMELTDAEGAWLRDQIVERFNAATADAAQVK